MNEVDEERLGLDREEDHADQVAWARALLAAADWVILDSETTDLGDDAEIVQIAVLAHDGTTLLDTLVKPSAPIPAEATAVHKITDAHVADAPAWPVVAPQLLAAVGTKRIIAYNADFDRRMIEQTGRLAGSIGALFAKWECAMLAYAAWYGDYSAWDGTYRFQRLNGGHTAVDDCRAVLRLIRRMAADT